MHTCRFFFSIASLLVSSSRETFDVKKNRWFCGRAGAIAESVWCAMSPSRRATPIVFFCFFFTLTPELCSEKNNGRAFDQSGRNVNLFFALLAPRTRKCSSSLHFHCSKNVYTYIMKIRIHSSYEIEDFVETHVWYIRLGRTIDPLLE